MLRKLGAVRHQPAFTKRDLRHASQKAHGSLVVLLGAAHNISRAYFATMLNIGGANLVGCFGDVQGMVAREGRYREIRSSYRPDRADVRDRSLIDVERRDRVLIRFCDSAQ